MWRYLVEPRDQIIIKGYGFLSFGRNMGKSIVKKIGKFLSVYTAKNFLIIPNNRHRWP